MKNLKLSRSSRQTFVLFGLLIVLMVVFAVENPKFISLYNMMNIVRQYVPHILIGCAMMFVITSGAIDLSVGGVMAFSAIVYGYLCLWGVNPWLAIPIVACFGIFMGWLNMFIMEQLKLPAIMATMATWITSSGLALTMCKAIPISDPLVKPITKLSNLRFFDNKIPLALFIVIVFVALFIFLEKKTILGKYAIAIGGNANAAYFSGISVKKMRFIFFMLCSVMATLGGMWQVARLGSADPKIGNSMEFSVISACILGGVNIKGGEGSIIGVVIGTYMLAILTNGMQMMNIGAFYQQIAIGIVLLGAVLINYLSDYLMARRKRAKAAA